MEAAPGAQPLTEVAPDEQRRVIWKFALPIMDEPIVEVPSGSKFLSVAVQGDGLVAYFLCDPSMRIEPAERRFLIRGTGMEAPPDDPSRYRFCGTHPSAGGALVWHVWLEV